MKPDKVPDTSGFTIRKHGRSRFWAVHDAAGDLICVCVYKRGAREVARRLALGLAGEVDCLKEEASREAVRMRSIPAREEG